MAVVHSKCMTNHDIYITQTTHGHICTSFDILGKVTDVGPTEVPRKISGLAPPPQKKIGKKLRETVMQIRSVLR